MSVSRLLKKLFPLFAGIAFTIANTGCGLNPQDKHESTTSFVDITPQSTGQIAAASFTEQDSLTGTLTTASDAINTMSFQNSFSIPSASTLGKKALGKIRAVEVSPQIDFSDTGKGLIRLMYCKVELISKEYDTLVVKWDDIAKDTSVTTKNIISLTTAKIYLTGKTERLSITDLDKDGIVSGQPQYNGLAQFIYESTTGNIIEKLVMTVSAGDDKDFNTDADNKITGLSWSKTSAGIVTDSATFSDADGDGILIDKSKATPSAVDIVLYEKAPLLKPFVQSSTLNLRILTKGNDSDITITRLNGEERRKSGRIITIAMTDSHGALDIEPYDTAIITFATIPSTEFGWKDSTIFVFDVQSGINNAHDNLLYELHVRKQHLAGIVLSKTFDFTTKDPVKEGQKPISGHLQMTVTFSNNKTASIVADFDQNGFSGTWTDPDGNTKTVIWDSVGNTNSK